MPDELPPPYTQTDPEAEQTNQTNHPDHQSQSHLHSHSHSQNPHSEYSNDSKPSGTSKPPAGTWGATPGRPTSGPTSGPTYDTSHSYPSGPHYGHGYGAPGPHSPQGPLRYPPHYYCYSCNNTGVKSSGNSCKECWDRFGPRNFHVYPPPTATMGPVGYGHSAPPRVVRPGDPSIGGILCGRCRGSGVTHELILFEESCRVCGGVGRIIQ